ncbi:MAG: pesticidal protein Cry15Aa [Planctomycetes bacterium]|nr:pesticidal protein Cry15Aa [Planctomycetota bacterium]
MRTVKKYANRKLYDTLDKRYIRLEEIAALIQKGEEVRVCDNRTGEDVTSQTLSQVLAEREREKAGFLPKTILSHLIQRGREAVADAARKVAGAWTPGTALVSEADIEEAIDSLIVAGELGRREAERLRKALVQRLRAGARKVDAGLRERIESAMTRLNLASQTEIDRLRAKIEGLEQKLAAVDVPPPAAAPRRRARRPKR